MNVEIRPAVPADGDACGRIIYDAFKSVAERHGFPPHFPNEKIAVDRVKFCISHPSIYGVVAEWDGQVIAPIFLTSVMPSAVSARLPLIRGFKCAALDGASWKRFSNGRAEQPECASFRIRSTCYRYRFTPHSDSR